MKRYVLSLLAAAALLATTATSAPAQRATASAPASADDPFTFDLAGGFTTVRANAQPGACGCFFMYGGTTEIATNAPSGAALLFQFSQTNVSNINSGGHDLRLTTYLAGGRYSFHSRSSFTPFGQVLVGAGHSATNFAIDHATSTIAFAAGGGLDYDLSPQFSLRLVQAEYLLTHVANGGSNQQNQLRLTAGVVFHLTTPKRASH